MIISVLVSFEEEMQNILKEIYKNSIAKSKFEFNLIQILTSPHTAFRFIYNMESDIKELKQYEITRRIFPFERYFSIADLDAAIQEVINLLVLSFNYLRTLFVSISSELREETPPPSSMYT